LGWLETGYLSNDIATDPHTIFFKTSTTNKQRKKKSNKKGKKTPPIKA
jgi:hypothetical protein